MHLLWRENMSAEKAYLIAALTGRALAQSASRAQLPVVVLDLYNDVDTRRVATRARAVVAHNESFDAKALLKAMKITVHETKIAVGKIVDQIVEIGSTYNVIVVTDDGRSRLQRLRKGSVASDVVRRARTSVLDVR